MAQLAIDTRINELVLKREKCVAGFSEVCLQSAHHPLGSGRCDWKDEETAEEGQEEGGRCCGCGLGVQRDTGRLRWCPGNRWCRLLIVIPAALLPILGLLLLLSHIGSAGATGSPASATGTSAGGAAGPPRARGCTAVRYGNAEHLDAEEREVLSDMRTAFIPPESVVVPPNCIAGGMITGRRAIRSKRRIGNRRRVTRFLGNVSSDITIWANTSYGDNPLIILHKVSNFTLENQQDNERDEMQPEKKSVQQRSSAEQDHSAQQQELESSGDLDVSQELLGMASADEVDVPWKTVSTGQESGPIGDESEQRRGQPELEEAELAQPESVTRPPAVHAFWRGQGSAESIRRAQAEAMKQYIDPSADPCKDFYQHACGNWARVNPIPADKAGYDTFEMLRESLDAVLRDLLTRESRTVKVTITEDPISQMTHVKKIQRRNHHHHHSPAEHRRHHKHHQRHRIQGPTSRPDDDEDSKQTEEDTMKSERNRRSIIDILQRFHGHGKREIASLKLPRGIFNLHQIRLLRRIRSAISEEKIHKPLKHRKRHRPRKRRPIPQEQEETTDGILRDILQAEEWNRRTEATSEINVYNRKKTGDYNYASYDDDDEDIGYSTTNTSTTTNTTISSSPCGDESVPSSTKVTKTTTPCMEETVTTNSVSLPAENGSCDVSSPTVTTDICATTKKQKQKPMTGGKDNFETDATAKARDLYESCMNYEILEQRGTTPLLELLDTLGGWPAIKSDWDEEAFDWLQLTAQLRLYNNDVLIAEWVGPDIKNSDEYVIQFDQTSLGLPTRDYFLQPSNLQYLTAYKEYMVTVTTLLGSDPTNATATADDIIDFETKLAKITSAPEERRNVSVLYQRLTIGRLRQLVPQIDWQRYLTIVLDRPVNTTETVVMFALSYMQDLVCLLGKTESHTVSNYLMWRFVRHRVNNLDDRFQAAKQKFYYVLFGREQAPPRWKNCVSQVNSNMGMALGSLFVKKYFDENSKKDTITMTSDIQQSFRELLNMTDWIDNETKHLAALKVDAMLLRIGYPDYILDPESLNEKYKDVSIRKDKYFENTLDILQHLTRTEQARLGQLVNKTLWHTAPAVVNAYYSRNKNQIMFPAGILQPPFYHRYFPRSLNYGGIGVVIGHELTHGFDDKGRLFDRDGNLHRWWSDQAIAGFHERAQCLIDQYSNYTVAEVGMPIDGVNTQGENIADNGGIKQAFRAYERWLEEHGNSDETLPGLNATNTQLFFLNFAQVWCGAMRPEATRNKLKTAVHSPGKFRVIGTLSNSEDFAREYHCPRGSPMNPVEKCSVW